MKAAVLPSECSHPEHKIIVLPKPLFSEWVSDSMTANLHLDRCPEIQKRANFIAPDSGYVIVKEDE